MIKRALSLTVAIAVLLFSNMMVYGALDETTITTVLDEAMSTIAATDIVAADSSAYLDGSAWGTEDAEALQTRFGFGDDGISILAVEQTGKTHAVNGCMTKKFSPIRAGKGMNLTAAVTLRGKSTPTGAMIYLSDGGSNVVGVLRLRFETIDTYAWISAFETSVDSSPWTKGEEMGSVYLTGQGLDEKTYITCGRDDDGAESNLSGSSLYGYFLKDNTDIVANLTFTMEPSLSDTSSYDATVTLSANDCTYTASKTIDAAVVRSLNTIGLQSIGGTEPFQASERYGEADMKISALTMEKGKISRADGGKVTFGDIAYERNVIMLEEDVSQINADTVFENIDSRYIGGAAWGTADKDALAERFDFTDGKIDLKARLGNASMEKRFTPLQNGDKMRLTTTVTLGNSYAATGGMLYLSDGENKTMGILRFYHTYTAFTSWISAFETKVSNSPWEEATDMGSEYLKGTNVHTETTYTDTNNGSVNDYFGTATPTCELTFAVAPSEYYSGKYMASVELTGNGCTYTAFKDQLSAEDITSYNTLGITSIAGTEEIPVDNADKTDIAIGDITMERRNVSKTALAAGENTLYIPYTNSTGTAQPFRVIAAVCDAEGKQTGYEVFNYPDNTYVKEELQITVDITDPTTEYVRLFFFDNYQDLISLSKVKSTKL